MPFLNMRKIQQGIWRSKIYLDISDNQIHKTGKLPIKSKLYIEVRVMLTATINTSAHLMSGSTGKIEYM